MILQPEFEGLVRAADERCLTRFNRRLAAAYLAGSVALGEAWPGASDLDWFVFLRDEPTLADKAWRRRVQKRLEDEFPAASEVRLKLFSQERLRREGFWRFILRYNSRRVRGDNLIAAFERRGIRTPRPSRKLAKSRLPFVRRCLSEALAGRCPPALARLPTDPFLASRKLARNFVIVEGAFVLMCQRSFKSFKQEDVLQGLRETTRRWRPLLRKAKAILSDPYRAGIRPDDLMAEVGPFMNWAVILIEEA
jgi:predicted nucleotidyltransferase